MSRHFCFRIVHQQSADQYAERVALPFRACVFGIPIVVQSAFIGDSDRVGIVAAGVCADIPELSAPALPYTLRPDGTLFGSYAVGEIVSACKLDI